MSREFCWDVPDPLQKKVCVQFSVPYPSGSQKLSAEFTNVRGEKKHNKHIKELWWDTSTSQRAPGLKKINLERQYSKNQAFNTE